MDEPKSQTENERLIKLIEAIAFTLVIVLVVFRIIGCAEIYSIVESRR